ncbi:MAG: hypothetical protein KatS3mg129_1188 [Leptospiraceae bacterium]|nr:MAG: hypothetical protein KatS3mg129_1188 [Leptospiraceae bacterium]
MLFYNLKAYFVSIEMKYNIIVFILFLVHISCKPSSVFVKKYVQYNIEDEGFLNHNVLQTIGISELRNDAEDKLTIQNKCLLRAENIAKERMISILIHTYLSIRSNSKTEINTFQEDYPEKFTKADLIYWSLFFQPLLTKVTVPFQQIKDNYCKVVLRLEESDLLSKIKNPDNYE